MFSATDYFSKKTSFVQCVINREICGRSELYSQYKFIITKCWNMDREVRRFWTELQIDWYCRWTVLWISTNMVVLYKADVNSGSGLHPLLDSLQRYVPLVSKPFIQGLGHFLRLQGVTGSCQQNLQDNVGRLDFWTTWATLTQKSGLPTLPTKFC